MEANSNLFSIGFTGHRDRKFDIVDIVEAINIAIKYYNTLNYTAGKLRYQFVHGGAVGFDTQVKGLIESFNALEAELLPKYYEYKEADRWKAPLDRNETIVDTSYVLIAGWDGRDKGGTFYTIKYAASCKRKILTVPPI